MVTQFLYRKMKVRESLRSGMFFEKVSGQWSWGKKIYNSKQIIVVSAAIWFEASIDSFNGRCNKCTDHWVWIFFGELLRLSPSGCFFFIESPRLSPLGCYFGVSLLASQHPDTFFRWVPSPLNIWMLFFGESPCFSPSGCFFSVSSLAFHQWDAFFSESATPLLFKII